MGPGCFGILDNFAKKIQDPYISHNSITSFTESWILIVVHLKIVFKKNLTEKDPDKNFFCCGWSLIFSLSTQIQMQQL